MPRSDYIYLVTKDAIPIAAFTVKYEMEHWISQYWESDWLNRIGVFRMRDGFRKPKAPHRLKLISTKQDAREIFSCLPA